MATGVAFVEVRDEQGKLVHRFTITQDDIRAKGPDHLVRSTIAALPVEQLARKVYEASRS